MLHSRVVGVPIYRKSTPLDNLRVLSLPPSPLSVGVRTSYIQEKYCKPPSGRGGPSLSNPKIGWEHFFFRSKAIYHGEAPNKSPLAIVLPLTPATVEIETNPLRVKLLGLVSACSPKR